MPAKGKGGRRNSQAAIEVAQNEWKNEVKAEETESRFQGGRRMSFLAMKSQEATYGKDRAGELFGDFETKNVQQKKVR